MTVKRRAPQSVQRRKVVSQLRTNRVLVPSIIKGFARSLLPGRSQLRFDLLAQLWLDMLRYLAPNVRPIRLSQIGLDSVVVTGGVSRYDILVLCALSQALGCRTIFEIGTLLGGTTRLLAQNNQASHVYTLDLPSLEAVGRTRYDVTDPEYFESWNRGMLFHGTPEETRITPLFGDSASFDYSPYAGKMDLVFIDGSHSSSYVKSDTEAALTMLSPMGTIAWDDYTHYPSIYRYVNRLAPQLDRPVFQILGTRLAVYSRVDIVRLPGNLYTWRPAGAPVEQSDPAAPSGVR